MDVESLEDLLDTILPDEENSIISSEDFETAVHEMVSEYVESDIMSIMEEDYHATLVNEVFQLILVQFEDGIKFYDYEFCKEKIEEIIQGYYATKIPARSCEYEVREHMSMHGTKCRYDMRVITKTLDALRNKPQPEQRTNEWYVFRHNLITASNAYKAFMGKSEFNQLIYEKCQPLKVPSVKESDTQAPVNVDTTLHWGQKYENVSVLIYEDRHCTTIEDFGCIQHDTYSFIGASPDGINVDSSNPNFYGRMLEIKNIVNRDITGIPKLEYWVQMQMQMNTCDLDECDFLETRFKEFDNEEQYVRSFDDAADKCSVSDPDDLCQNEDEDISYKGVIMYFSRKGKPVYKYSKLNISLDELKSWEAGMMDETIDDNTIWVKNNYWWLAEYSCVLVMRNREWFDIAVSFLQSAWNTIETERETGYSHRAPMKRVPRQTPSDNTLFQSGCMITLNKETGSVNVAGEESTLPSETHDDSDGNNERSVMNLNHVRTESIDETRGKITSFRKDDA